MKNKSLNILIGGGGTGGHIFPALAIAQEIRKRRPDAQLLFLGAEGKMEMTRVPQAGFDIVGLPIAGLQRSLDLRNLALPFKVFSSLQKAISLVRNFKPDVIVGVGGYASFPALLAARVLGIPYLIQEQNSFAGLTNKLLAGGAKAICVAFAGMEKYFPPRRLQFTGNPVRTDLIQNHIAPFEAVQHFGLMPGRPTLLVLGGSLGARTINQAVEDNLESWVALGFQVVWQTGKAFAEQAARKVKTLSMGGVVTMPFIDHMHYAYAAADLVVSRAGALSIAEICVAGKPSILIPSPNVAEDHQTKNAQSLSSVGAALLIPDQNAKEKLGAAVANLLNDSFALERMGMQAHQLARPDATDQIVNQIIKLAAA